jgi:hypothetical protein
MQKMSFSKDFYEINFCKQFQYRLKWNFVLWKFMLIKYIIQSFASIYFKLSKKALKIIKIWGQKMNFRRKKKLSMKKEIGIENGIGIDRKSCFFNSWRKMLLFRASGAKWLFSLPRAKSASFFELNIFNSSLMFLMRAEGEQNRFKRE